MAESKTKQLKDLISHRKSIEEFITLAEADNLPYDKDQLLFHIAWAFTDRTDLAEYLLSLNADINFQSEDFDDKTSLMGCVSGPNYAKDALAMVKLLLKNKADVSIRDNDGYAALDYATIAFRTTIMKLLVKAGADVNGTNLEGDTALMLVHEENKAKYAVDTLKELGADFDIVNEDGYTALMKTVDDDYPVVVQALLDAGANKHFVNEEGESATTLAEDADELIQELLQG